MLHGPQRDYVDLSFAVPSICAQEVEKGQVEIGLVPVAEIARQNLEIVPGVCISCLGSVRSILLFSRVPWKQIRTLAADATSRTSVQLARVVLRERYGAEPRIASQAPNLDSMLREADAALLIGDSALLIDPQRSSYECLDLGREWFSLTGLPMVFAAWAGKTGRPLSQLSQLTVGSYGFGRNHLSEIVDAEYQPRGITRELAEQYLTHYIRYEMGEKEQTGLEAFLELAGLRTSVLVPSSS